MARDPDPPEPSTASKRQFDLDLYLRSPERTDGRIFLDFDFDSTPTIPKTTHARSHNTGTRSYEVARPKTSSPPERHRGNYPALDLWPTGSSRSSQATVPAPRQQQQSTSTSNTSTHQQSGNADPAAALSLSRSGSGDALWPLGPLTKAKQNRAGCCSGFLPWESSPRPATIQKPAPPAPPHPAFPPPAAHPPSASTHPLRILLAAPFRLAQRVGRSLPRPRATPPRPPRPRPQFDRAPPPTPRTAAWIVTPDAAREQWDGARWVRYVPPPPGR